MLKIAIVLLALTLTSCGGSGGESNSADSYSDSMQDSPEKSVAAIDTSPFSEIHLCKATIHAVMGASPSIMRTSDQFGSTIVAYNRESDGKLWDYMCRLDGDRMVWGINGGRWQNHQLDEYISVSVNSETSTLNLRILHSDNSSQRYEHTLSELE